MCRLSLERCACFLFLVALAIFSCSGFRIDSLEKMLRSDSKRNPLTSSSSFSSDFLHLFDDTWTPTTTSPTPLRHRRHSSHHLPPYDTSSYYNRTPTRVRPAYRRRTNTGRRTGGQLVATAAPSSDQHQQQQRQRRQRRGYHCQRQDVARKAYLADTVVVAKAESMSSNRVHNYSVTFRILERYKTSTLPVDDTLRLTFSSDTKDMNCETSSGVAAFGGGRRSHRGGSDHLVKAQIQQSKEYFLFLDSHGMHNYSVVGMPVLKKRRKDGRRNRDLEDIKRVTSPHFVAKSAKPKIRTNRTDDLKPGKKLRLTCNVGGGFPVPYVFWRKDGLHPNKRTRITYKKKRTTLVINPVQADDEGLYQCIAKGVDGATVQDQVRVRISNRNECKDERYKENFCLNGGTCVRIMHKEIACQCPDGFTGERCGEKDVSNHSSEDSDWTTPSIHMPE